MTVHLRVKEVINALVTKLGREFLPIKKKKSDAGFNKTKMGRNCCRMQK
jgi:hypothetical protein